MPANRETASEPEIESSFEKEPDRPKPLSTSTDKLSPSGEDVDRAQTLRQILIALNRSNISRDAVCRLGASLDLWLDAPPADDPALSHALATPLAQLQAARGVVGQASEKALEEERVAERLGAVIVTRLDSAYPQPLFDLELPPPVLYLQGTIPKRPAIAIVGPRNPDPHALEATEMFARDLVLEGLAVVSGFARGVDIRAHRTVLELPEGRTVAVLGSGLGARYPHTHYRQRSRIAEAGAVVSEFPCHFGPLPRNFPIRNRIIAALAQATLVIQASARSGSLITARCALDLGREVLAVPGRIFDRRCVGSNALLRDGAHVALEASSVIDILPLDVRERISAQPPERGPAEGGEGDFSGARDNLGDPLTRRVLLELMKGTRGAEALARTVEAPIGAVLAALLELEVDRRVTRLQGARFTLRRDG